MLNWIGKRKNGKAAVNAEMSVTLQKESYFPGDTLYGAVFVLLDKSLFPPQAPASAAVTSAASPPLTVARLTVILKGSRINRLGLHDHIDELYHQAVVLYPPDPNLPIPSNISTRMTEAGAQSNGGGVVQEVVAGTSVMNDIRERDYQRACRALQKEGSYIYPFRVPLPCMLPWSENVTTPSYIGIRSTFKYFAYVEMELASGKVFQSPKLPWSVKPLPIPFWRWSRLKHEDELTMPEERNRVLGVTTLPVSKTIHCFINDTNNNNNNNIADSYNNNVAALVSSSGGSSRGRVVSPTPQQPGPDDAEEGEGRKHKHRHKHKHKHRTSHDEDPTFTPPSSQTPAAFTPPSEHRQAGDEEGRKHRHKHKHRSSRHHQSAGAAALSGTTPVHSPSLTPNPKSVSPTMVNDREMEQYNQSVLSFDPKSIESLPLGGEPRLGVTDPSLFPFDRTLIVNLRTSLVTRLKISARIRLSSQILVPGGRPLVIEVMLDSKADPNVTLVSKIRALLKIKYLYLTPAAQDFKVPVVSASTGTLKHLSSGEATHSLRLEIPASTPLSQLSDAAQYRTKLHIKFFTHTTMKDFEEKIKFPIIFAAGVDRSSFNSRRLSLWTTNFLHQSIVAKELAKTKGIGGGASPIIQQAQRQLVAMDPREMELLVHRSLVVSAGAGQGIGGGYVNLEKSANENPPEGDTDTMSMALPPTPNVVTTPNPTEAGLTYGILVRIISSDDPHVVTYIPSDYTFASPGNKFFDPNPLQ